VRLDRAHQDELALLYELLAQKEAEIRSLLDGAQVGLFAEELAEYWSPGGDGDVSAAAASEFFTPAADSGGRKDDTGT
jgi:hypothetical protein